MSRDRRVDVNLPLFSQLHDADVGEKLGNRAYAVHGVSWRRHLAHGIGITEAASVDRLIAVDECDRNGREILVLKFVLNQSLQGGDDLRVVFP